MTTALAGALSFYVGINPPSEPVSGSIIAMVTIVGMVPVVLVPAAVMTAPVVAPVAAMRFPVMPVMALTVPIAMMAMMTIVDRLNGRLNFRLGHIHHRRGRCCTGADKQADAKDCSK
ncbi:hypothetical protein [Rhizobium sp. RCC_161_2]|uniref:hypothetical protein n=1 Tax=Rhizobium sp. RCC_161_2 TaxID=3239219 RepID=UPI003524D92A